MGRRIKTRCRALGRDVTINRLTTSELQTLIYDPDTAIVVDPCISTVVEDDGSEYSVFGPTAAMVGVVLEACVSDFKSRVLPDLLALDDTKFSNGSLELYRECILANPVLDAMAASIYTHKEPLEPDLTRLVAFVPTLSDSVVNHMTRLSITDTRLTDAMVSATQVLDVPDDVVSLDLDAELTLDLERVRNLPAKLSASVVGQQYAVSHVTGVAKRVAAGFRDPSRPPAVMMFVGPSGVGKTLLAKETATTLFGSESAFGRIDCASLSEKHGASKLFGPPPGYVGYPSSRDPSESEEDVKKRDPSVLYKETLGMESGGLLLFDEIEKADPDVLDSLLTVLDEGYVKTSIGNYVNLRNVIIVITSNLGTRQLADEKNKRAVGFLSSRDVGPKETDITDIKRTAMTAIRDFMKPEFISRINAIIPFQDLTKEQLKAVVDLEWAKASEYINETLPIEIILTEGLKERLAQKAIDRGSGARYISRLVDSYVVDALADLYLADAASLLSGKVTIDFKEQSTDSCDVVTITYGTGQSTDFSVSSSIGEE